MKKSVSIIISILSAVFCMTAAVSAYADGNVLTIDATNTVVAVEEVAQTYDGTEKKPGFVVYYNNILLQPENYQATYSDNVEAGTGKITVTGIGNYSGSVTKEFTISSINLSDNDNVSVDIDKASLVYNDAEVIPIIYVSYDKGGEIGEQYLIQDIDYTIKLSKNNSPGKASVTITGIGNYSGSITKSFVILPSKVQGVTVSKPSDTSALIKWAALSKVSGYEIQKYDFAKKKYVHLAYLSSKTTSYKITGLKNANGYSYKIRAYKTVDEKKKYGEASDEISTFVNPSKVSVISVTMDNKKLTVDWKKVNCSGYEIFYTTDSKFKKNIKSVKLDGASKTSKTIPDLKKGKIYYVKVRAYKKYNGKIYNGKKSSVVSSYFSNVYSTYYSYYVSNANRTNNLKLASKAISGTIIQPGEYFDFNDVVGPRTAAKGYKNAHVFSGEAVVNGIGGGICQVASTMFNTTLLANLQISERHQHVQRVSYVPLGRDAAISGTAQNFRWKNNTKYAIKIEMTVKDGVITCTYYTCQKAKPKKVKLSVSQSGKNFTLKRTVDGKVNYKCRSNY